MSTKKLVENGDFGKKIYSTKYAVKYTKHSQN